MMSDQDVFYNKQTETAVETTISMNESSLTQNGVSLLCGQKGEGERRGGQRKKSLAPGVSSSFNCFLHVRVSFEQKKICSLDSRFFRREGILRRNKLFPSRGLKVD